MNNIDTIMNLIMINMTCMRLLKDNMNRIEDKKSEDYLNLAAVMHALETQNKFFVDEGREVASQIGLAAI